MTNIHNAQVTVDVGIGEHGTMGRLLGSEAAVKIAQRSTVPVLAVPRDAFRPSSSMARSSTGCCRTWSASGVISLRSAGMIKDSSADFSSAAYALACYATHAAKCS